MPYQVVNVPIDGGIDAKTDARTLQPPKLADLQNGVFTKGAIKKRNGFSALGGNYSHSESLVAPAALPTLRALFTRTDRSLVACDNAYLYAYAPSEDRWYRDGINTHITSLVPTYRSPPVDTSSGQLDTTSVARSSVAGTNGNYTIYAYETKGSTGFNYSVIDATSGNVLYSAVIGSARKPRCVTLGGKLWIFYAGAAANHLGALAVDPTLLGSASTPVTTYDLATNLNTSYLFDVEVDTLNSRFVVAFASTTANTTEVGTVSTLGVYASKQTLSAGATLSAVAVAVEPTVGYVALSTASTSATTGIECTIYNAALGLLLVGPVVLDSTARTYRNITAAWESGTIGGGDYRVTTLYEAAGSSNEFNFLCGGTLTVNGTSTSAGAIMRKTSLASRPWRDSDGALYVMAAHDSSLQPAYLVVRLDPSQIGGVQQNQHTIAGCFLNGSGGGATVSTGWLPHVENVGGRVYGAALLKKDTLETQTTTTTKPSAYYKRTIEFVDMDFNSISSHRVAQAHLSAYVSGGIVHQYDGRIVSESGFLFYPETIAAPTQSNSTGSLVPGATYAYRFYYEYIDANGERTLSTCFAATTVTMGAGNNLLQFQLPTLIHTNRTATSVGIAVYRTQANPGSTANFYRASSTDPSSAGATNGYWSNSLIADTLPWSDGVSDATLATQELDYQNGGELENIAPPAAKYLCSGKGRLFLAGLDDPYTIWYSKKRVSGRAVEFNDALTLTVPEDGGDITGLAVLNDVLIVFKRDRLYAIAGDGPDNTGLNGSFNDPQLITSDAGCVNAKTIVTTPMGLMFQSSRGIYLLGQNLQLDYIGAPVEPWGTQNFVGAVCVASQNQVRFLPTGTYTAASDGTVRILVYDYFFQQWTTWLTSLGGSFSYSAGCTMWQGPSDTAPTFYWVGGTGSTVYKENVSATSDAGGSAITLSITTPWLSLAQLQGTERVRRVVYEIDKTGGVPAQLSLTVAHDYASVNAPSDQTVSLSTPSADGTYQERTRTSVQKGQSVQINLVDLSTNQIAIAGLALEALTKTGVAKLPAGNTF